MAGSGSETCACQPALERVKLAISGQVNRAVNLANDGDKTKAYFVDNDVSNTRVRFEGTAAVTDATTLGSTVEVAFSPNNSYDVSQDNESADDFTDVRKADIWARNDAYGRLLFGKGAAAADAGVNVEMVSFGMKSISLTMLIADADASRHRARERAVQSADVRDPRQVQRQRIGRRQVDRVPPVIARRGPLGVVRIRCGRRLRKRAGRLITREPQRIVQAEEQLRRQLPRAEGVQQGQSDHFPRTLGLESASEHLRRVNRDAIDGYRGIVIADGYGAYDAQVLDRLSLAIRAVGLFCVVSGGLVMAAADQKRVFGLALHARSVPDEQMRARERLPLVE